MKTPDEVIERHRHLDTKAILRALEGAGFAIIPLAPTPAALDALYGTMGESDGADRAARTLYAAVIDAARTQTS